MNTLSRISSKAKRLPLFRTTSRSILFAASVLIVVGYIMMAGPGSTDQAFNPDIFAPRRIVVAPILCLTGYLLIIVGIVKKV